MKPKMKPERTAEQRAEEEAIRRQHAANPVRQRPAGAINQQSFAAILSLVARFKAVRESQGLTLAEVAERMAIDPPALSRLETGKMLNPTLATLHKWAEALGQNSTLSYRSHEWRCCVSRDDHAPAAPRPERPPDTSRSLRGVRLPLLG